MSPERASSFQRTLAALDIVRLNAPASVAVNAGRVDPVDVADALLAQAARHNPAVNALVDHDEGLPGLCWWALAAGRVPVAAKDSVRVEGQRIT